MTSTRRSASPISPSDVHPVLRSSLTAYPLAAVNDWGRLVLGYRGGLVMGVGPTGFDRAIRLLHQIFTGAEARSWEVLAKPDHRDRHSPCISWMGEDVVLVVTEEMQREPHEATPEEQRRQRRTWEPIPRFDFTSTGLMRLTLEHYMPGQRKAYRDGQRQKLEDQVVDILDTIGTVLAWEQERTEERKREEIEQQRRHEVARVAAVDRRRHEHRADVVARHVEDWRTARDLRRYMLEVRTRLRHLQPERHQPTEAWLAWVEHYLDHDLDPRVAFPTLPIGDPPPEDPLRPSSAWLTGLRDDASGWPPGARRPWAG